ncbi:DNA methyltransferase [Acidovorax radicis]|nr:DNA methyltransferase [Acidovorax radicis]
MRVALRYPVNSRCSARPGIRECFKAFDMEALKLDYTVGGGANRVERGELIIYNWDLQAEPAGLF